MTRPTALPVNMATILPALTGERRWVVWRYEWQQHDGKKGRWTKILCTPIGRHAKSNDPSTWTTFAHALAAYQAGGFDGIGFCLGDGWAGIDLDKLLTRPIVDRLACYVETSPSGTGLKAIGRSQRIGGEITRTTKHTWSSARFFAITGHGSGDPCADISDPINDWFPAQSNTMRPAKVPAFIRPGDVRGTENIERFTDDQVVERILATPSADKFLRLVRGDASEYENDLSRADQALCSLLARSCQGDLDQVDRLFRESGLMRDKWNTASYRRATLAKAVRF
jgi:putative DNA primase/helicase